MIWSAGVKIVGDRFNGWLLCGLCTFSDQCNVCLMTLPHLGWIALFAGQPKRVFAIIDQQYGRCFGPRSLAMRRGEDTSSLILLLSIFINSFEIPLRIQKNRIANRC